MTDMSLPTCRTLQVLWCLRPLTEVLEALLDYSGRVSTDGIVAEPLVYWFKDVWTNATEAFAEWVLTSKDRLAFEVALEADAATARTLLWLFTFLPSACLVESMFSDVQQQEEGKKRPHSRFRIDAKFLQDHQPESAQQDSQQVQPERPYQDKPLYQMHWHLQQQGFEEFKKKQHDQKKRENIFEEVKYEMEASSKNGMSLDVRVLLRPVASCVSCASNVCGAAAPQETRNGNDRQQLRRRRQLTMRHATVCDGCGSVTMEERRTDRRDRGCLRENFHDAISVDEGLTASSPSSSPSQVEASPTEKNDDHSESKWMGTSEWLHKSLHFPAPEILISNLRKDMMMTFMWSGAGLFALMLIWVMLVFLSLPLSVA